MTVEATLLFRGPGAEELRSICTQRADVAEIHGARLGDDPGEELWHTGTVNRDWLVSAVAAYAPTVVVMEPPEVVTEVIEVLNHVHRIANPES